MVPSLVVAVLPEYGRAEASIGSRYRDSMTTVRIIGGGIAGATLAATLERPDWAVTVHERRAQTPALDTAFALFPQALRALQPSGLRPAVEAAGVRIDAAQILTAEGRPLLRPPRLGALMIGRARLHSLLSAARPASTVLDLGEVDAPEDLDADVLVGADGAQSMVRRTTWGARSAPRRPPLTVIRGVVDADLSNGSVTEYWGERMLFGITPLPGGRTNWFTAFPERRFASVADGLDHLRTAARVLPDPVTDVVDAATVEQSVISGIHLSVPCPPSSGVEQCSSAIPPTRCSPTSDGARASRSSMPPHSPNSSTLIHRSALSPSTVAADSSPRSSSARPPASSRTWPSREDTRPGCATGC